jgi:hypothetical protein
MKNLMKKVSRKSFWKNFWKSFWKHFLKTFPNIFPENFFQGIAQQPQKSTRRRGTLPGKNQCSAVVRSKDPGARSAEWAEQLLLRRMPRLCRANASESHLLMLLTLFLCVFVRKQTKVKFLLIKWAFQNFQIGNFGVEILFHNFHNFHKLKSAHFIGVIFELNFHEILTSSLTWKFNCVRSLFLFHQVKWAFFEEPEAQIWADFEEPEKPLEPQRKKILIYRHFFLRSGSSTFGAFPHRFFKTKSVKAVLQKISWAFSQISIIEFERLW